ncbi:MAG: hypothetical protein PHH09_12675 [Methanoregulaceae archaeon]|jgi:rRNA maturation endonuclease Nob1|nr:hypothetical protein [Methanoregulaceae archaeon]
MMTPNMYAFLYAPRCPARDCGRRLYCWRCGSTNVVPRGFVGVNHRHVCQVCGNEVLR